MKSEIEVKFLNVDIADVRTKLTSVGAECESPMRLMRRVIIDYADRRLQVGKDAFVRVRDEGDKVSLTYKQFDKLSVDGAKEIETIVGDFESTVQLFEAIGLERKSTQESLRETWKLGGIEIVIDEWPWLNTYIEIEGASETELKEVAQQLGFDWTKAVFGDVMMAYRSQYPKCTMKDTIGTLLEVKFGTPVPEMMV